MRVLQRFLLVIGLTSLGATAGGLGLGYLAAFTLFRPRPGEDPSLAWGSGIGILLCMALGAGSGALAGFTTALSRGKLTATRVWKLPVWMGIAVGLAAGVWICLMIPERSLGLIGEIIETWPGTLIFATATTTLGGLIGQQVSRR